MLLFRYFKVFKVHIADGYGITAQIHYELTVAQDAHDVAFLSFQHTGEYAQFDVVFGEFLKGVAKEGDTFGLLFHDFHERAHLAVGNRGGFARAAVVH